MMVGMMCSAAVLTAATVLPSTLICLPFLFYYFRSLRAVYLKSSREIKRIESVSKSPVFVMLREALSGLPTIRSQQGARMIFLDKFHVLQDENASAMFSFIASARWLGIRLDFISFVLLFFAIFAAVVFHQHVDGVDIDPSTLGLVSERRAKRASNTIHYKTNPIMHALRFARCRRRHFRIYCNSRGCSSGPYGNLPRWRHFSSGE